MKNRVKRGRVSPQERTLGDQTFAAIAAVEGLSLSSTSRKRLDRLRDSDMSPGEQRAEVIRAYMSGR